MHIEDEIVYALCLRHDRVASVRVRWFAVAVLLLLSNMHCVCVMTLPPRTPSWMPLDYAVWDRVMDKVTEESPTDDMANKK